MSENYKEESRKGWYRSDGNPSTDDLKLGCLQRIADATEVMSNNYVKLISERDMYKRWYEQERASCQRLSRQNNALRGVITRLKRAAIVGAL